MRLFLYRVLCLAALMLGNFANLGGQALAQSANANADLTTAREAYARHDVKTLERIRARFAQTESGHILRPYVEYWTLSAKLMQPQAKVADFNAEIRAFLATYADSAAAEQMRRDWLRALGSADAAAEFADAYTTYTGDDAEITCQHWRMRAARGDREALTEAKTLWKAARAAPEACYLVFQQLAAAAQLSEDEAWARVRALFTSNQGNDARRTAALMASLPASFERDALAAARDPAGFLKREKLNPKSRSAVETTLFALGRLARTNPQTAAAWLNQHASTWPAEMRAHAWAQVGFFAAQQHDPQASEWFAKAGDTPLDDAQAAWKARAALRVRDWAAVASAVDAMSVTERAESAWRYWRARAEVEQGRGDAVRLARETLAKETHFYGILSAEELGLAASPSWQALTPPSADIAAVSKHAGIRRALALYQLEMRREAIREWATATRGMSDQQLLAAALVARDADAPDRSIQAADRTVAVHDYTQRYPLHHRALLGREAKIRQLDEAWVYGLIRQESRFQASVHSPVGAAGLMQLMPPTAKWVANQVGLKNFAPKSVIEVPVNLQLGSYYLRHVLDQLGHPVLATAAYNAGPGRAKRWQAAQALEGAIYAETIPFNETRDYVKKVMANAWFYQHQLGVAKPSLKSMMGTISGRNLSSALAVPTQVAAR